MDTTQNNNIAPFMITWDWSKQSKMLQEILALLTNPYLKSYRIKADEPIKKGDNHSEQKT